MEKDRNILPKRCVIVGGATMRNLSFVKGFLHQEDYAIYCDSGLRHRKRIGLEPDLIVGDFDSHRDPHLPVETITLPREKDDTDTVFALREGIRRGFQEFLLIGVIGGRFDHSLGNLYLLTWLQQEGKKALLVDDYSSMEMVGAKKKRVPADCRYFSLLNITGKAEGVTVENAKYTLENASIPYRYPYGISNEVLPGKETFVAVREGALLLVSVYYEQGEF